MSREAILSALIGLVTVGTLVLGMGHIMHQSSLGAGLQPGKTMAVLISYGLLVWVFLIIGVEGWLATSLAFVCGLVATLAWVTLVILGIPLGIISIACVFMGMGFGMENPMLIVLLLIAWLASPALFN